MSTYTKKSLLMSFLALASLLVASVAHADPEDGKGFVELAVGQAMPQGEDQWDDAFDDAVKFGVRGGMWARGGLGFELALDYTPLDSDEGNFGNLASANWDWNRVRLLVGGRIGTNVSRRVKVFGRLDLGADYVSGSGSVTVLGITRSHEESDLGLAAEIGGGVLFNFFGAFSAGLQLAVPMAFHGTEQDEDHFFNYEYNAYDLDVMLTLASAF